MEIRLKRGYKNTETGLYFLRYDKTMKGGIQWGTEEKLIEYREKGRLANHKNRKEEKWINYAKEYNRKPSVVDKRRKKQNKGIGRGKGVRIDSRTEQEAKKYNLEWKKSKRKTNSAFKLELLVRTALYRIKASGFKSGGRKFIDIIGCDYETLKLHLESKFLPDMTWENHGKFGWHIDHVIPLASAKTISEKIKLMHFTNLQPLWWRDNLVKSSKIINTK